LFIVHLAQGAGAQMNNEQCSMNNIFRRVR
jgi:hypothetical protein